jgi:hypothetical protein
MAQESKVCESRYCPECGSDWRGHEIPHSARQSYGNATHFSRLIGVEVRQLYDGVYYWQCPDCKMMWNRWTGQAFKPREKDKT